jgi:hypothetical protein
VFNDGKTLATRISDLATATNTRFEDMRDFIRSEIARVDRKPDRITDTLGAMLNDHEQRMRSIEQQRPR